MEKLSRAQRGGGGGAGASAQSIGNPPGALAAYIRHAHQASVLLSRRDPKAQRIVQKPQRKPKIPDPTPRKTTPRRSRVQGPRVIRRRGGGGRGGARGESAACILILSHASVSSAVEDVVLLDGGFVVARRWRWLLLRGRRRRRGAGRAGEICMHACCMSCTREGQPRPRRRRVHVGDRSACGPIRTRRYVRAPRSAHARVHGQAIMHDGTCAIRFCRMRRRRYVGSRNACGRTRQRRHKNILVRTCIVQWTHTRVHRRVIMHDGASQSRFLPQAEGTACLGRARHEGEGFAACAGRRRDLQVHRSDHRRREALRHGTGLHIHAHFLDRSGRPRCRRST